MTNELHRKLAARILDHLRSISAAEGDRVAEPGLVSHFSVSRAPLRGALALLAEAGVLRREENRGYFVVDRGRGDELFDIPGSESDVPDARIVRDRMAEEIPPTVSENRLMRRYGLTRVAVSRALSRLANIGLVERREAKGWTFVPLPGVRRRSLEIRRAVEPAAILSADFELDRSVVAELVRSLLTVRDGGWESFPDERLSSAFAAFHLGLLGMCHNGFMLDTVERHLEIDRLTHAPGRSVDREQARRLNERYLGVLRLLEAGEKAEAAQRLSLALADEETLHRPD